METSSALVRMRTKAELVSIAILAQLLTPSSGVTLG
jgi:hypothetical protein